MIFSIYGLILSTLEGYIIYHYSATLLCMHHCGQKSCRTNFKHLAKGSILNLKRSYYAHIHVSLQLPYDGLPAIRVLHTRICIICDILYELQFILLHPGMVIILLFLLRAFRTHQRHYYFSFCVTCHEMTKSLWHLQRNNCRKKKILNKIETRREDSRGARGRTPRMGKLRNYASNWRQAN